MKQWKKELIITVSNMSKNKLMDQFEFDSKLLINRANVEKDRPGCYDFKFIKARKKLVWKRLKKIAGEDF